MTLTEHRTPDPLFPPMHDGPTNSARAFTLMEVVIAAMVLSMSAAMVFGIVGTARARLLRAERRWGRQHVMTQATEFYLLAGKDAVPPDDLLPEGFSPSCTVSLAEGLPEEAAEGLAGWEGWRLGKLQISVSDPNGRVVDEWTIEKLVREDDYY